MYNDHMSTIGFDWEQKIKRYLFTEMLVTFKVERGQLG
jgi:hypothetical protein